MSRLTGVLSVFFVLLLSMGFAAANAGYRVTLSLGFITLYQVPVTLVAFSGLFLGMVVMFVTGIHSDLKVRRILRERLADESRQEQSWIDRHQQDLFSDQGTDREGSVAHRPTGPLPDPVAPLAEEPVKEPAKEDPTPNEAAEP
jgi:uncharacterized integral membrane protein